MKSSVAAIGVWLALGCAALADEARWEELVRALPRQLSGAPRPWLGPLEVLIEEHLEVELTMVRPAQGPRLPWERRIEGAGERLWLFDRSRADHQLPDPAFGARTITDRSKVEVVVERLRFASRADALEYVARARRPGFNLVEVRGPVLVRLSGNFTDALGAKLLWEQWRRLGWREPRDLLGLSLPGGPQASLSLAEGADRDASRPVLSTTGALADEALQRLADHLPGFALLEQVHGPHPPFEEEVKPLSIPSGQAAAGVAQALGLPLQGVEELRGAFRTPAWWRTAGDLVEAGHPLPADPALEGVRLRLDGLTADLLTFQDPGRALEYAESVRRPGLATVVDVRGRSVVLLSGPAAADPARAAAALDSIWAWKPSRQPRALLLARGADGAQTWRSASAWSYAAATDMRLFAVLARELEHIPARQPHRDGERELEWLDAEQNELLISSPGRVQWLRRDTEEILHAAGSDRAAVERARAAFAPEGGSASAPDGAGCAPGLGMLRALEGGLPPD